MKDPKEHAKKILEKCTILHYMKLGKGKGLPISMYESQRKGCAVVVVDECINLLNFINQTVETPLTKHYLEVKQEIEKL